MTLAILDCLNPGCSMRKPYGFCVELAELPELDPEAPVEGAQTDWPICDVCFGPMTLDDLAEPVVEGEISEDS